MNSDVDDVPKLREADAPSGAVTGVDAGGALVDAHDGADDGAEVFVFEGDFLADAQVTAGGSRCCGYGTGDGAGLAALVGSGCSMAA